MYYRLRYRPFTSTPMPACLRKIVTHDSHWRWRAVDWQGPYYIRRTLDGLHISTRKSSFSATWRDRWDWRHPDYDRAQDGVLPHVMPPKLRKSINLNLREREPFNNGLWCCNLWQILLPMLAFGWVLSLFL